MVDMVKEKGNSLTIAVSISKQELMDLDNFTAVQPMKPSRSAVIRAAVSQFIRGGNSGQKTRD